VRVVIGIGGARVAHGNGEVVDVRVATPCRTTSWTRGSRLGCSGARRGPAPAHGSVQRHRSDRRHGAPAWAPSSTPELLSSSLAVAAQ
jgi:hypothetical protein